MGFEHNPPVRRDVVRDPAKRQQLKAVDGVLADLIKQVQSELEQETPDSDQAAHLRGLLNRLNPGERAVAGAVTLLTSPREEQERPPSSELTDLPLDIELALDPTIPID